MGRESTASGYRSKVTMALWGTSPLLRMTQSLKCIWQDIKRDAYNECDSRKVVRYRKRTRQTQTMSVPLWRAHDPTHCCFNHFLLLFSVISALVWFEGHICLFFSYSNFPKLKNAMTMIWGKLESHLTFSKLYIPQSEKLNLAAQGSRSRPSMEDFFPPFKD